MITKLKSKFKLIFFWWQISPHGNKEKIIWMAITTNLTCAKIIIKTMGSSFIHKFVHFTQEYHALKTHLTHWEMCWWMKYKPMNK